MATNALRFGRPRDIFVALPALEVDDDDVDGFFASLAIANAFGLPPDDGGDRFLDDTGGDRSKGYTEQKRKKKKREENLDEKNHLVMGFTIAWLIMRI